MTLSRRLRSWRWTGLALVLLVGLTARLVPWTMTFTGDGVRFRTDTDPYYHALRAQRTVADWPRVPWTDPNMNFPYGAQIPWPPLFDFAIAALAKAAGATAADPERVARVAALLGLVVGVALLPLVAWLGQRLLGDGPWLDAALLVALLPANIRFGAVGAADQHGAELLLSSGVFLAFVSSWRGVGQPAAHPWRGPAVLGILIATAFWNWLGSALYLLILVAVTGLWYVLAPARDGAARGMSRALFLGGLLGATLLAVSIALLAPSGALGRGGLNGLTGLHVAMCAVTAAFGGLLLAADRMTTGRRLARFLNASAAVALSLLPILLVSPLRDGVFHGLAALSRGNPWYRAITEYRPTLLSRLNSIEGDLRVVRHMFGLGLFAMPLALLPMWRRWKRCEPDRAPLFFLFLWGSIFLALTLFEQRFQLYLVIPMAFWICFALRELADRVSRRWPSRAGIARLAVPAIGVLLVASPAQPFAWTGDYSIQQPGVESDMVPSLQWLRRVPSGDPARPAVMGEWSVGHLVQYFAGKPVIVTPFGTDLDESGQTSQGPSGMKDWGAFLFATDPDVAEDVLARRRAGFVFLSSPKDEVVVSFGYAPPPAIPPMDLSFDWLSGPTLVVRREFFRLIASRLYYFDGMPADNVGPSLGGFRLLYESATTEWIKPLPPAQVCKIFGVVSGARIALRGGEPGAVVTARTRIQTNQGRVFEWVTRTPIDAEGRAALRLPYATGENGLVRAGPYNLSDDVHHGTLTLDEKDVAGGRMEIDLGS